MDDYPKELDGGWWELSSGEKVQGEEKAVQAERAIQRGLAELPGGAFEVHRRDWNGHELLVCPDCHWDTIVDEDDPETDYFRARQHVLSHQP